MGAHLGGQSPGDFTHRRQQWKAAVVELDGFVGDGCGAGLEQGLPHLRVGRQMQIGQQHHVLPQEVEFLGLGLLHLHHQVRGPGLVPVDNRHACGGKGLIADAGSCTCAGFDADLQPAADQLPSGIRRQGHPAFIGLDFPWDANGCHWSAQHGGSHGRRSLRRGWFQSGHARPGWPAAPWELSPLSWRRSASASRCRRPGDSP